MTTTSREQKIDDLMESASAALAATRYFEAERLAWQALGAAHSAKDFERMGRIALPLQEARRQRYQQALDVGTGGISGNGTINASGGWYMRP